MTSLYRTMKKQVRVGFHFSHGTYVFKGGYCYSDDEEEQSCEIVLTFKKSQDNLVLELKKEGKKTSKVFLCWIIDLSVHCRGSSVPHHRVGHWDALYGGFKSTSGASTTGPSSWKNLLLCSTVHRGLSKMRVPKNLGLSVDKMVIWLWWGAIPISYWVQWSFLWYRPN